MKIYGIDLGTTYSAISYRTDDGHIQVINNMDGDKITASAVFFERDSNDIIVGRNAMYYAYTDPEYFVNLIKREMGTSWSKEFNGRTYTPESISALIINYLIKSAEYEGHNVTDVVITCPACFNEWQRRATKAAAEACGVKVHAVLDEPIAAALSYGFRIAVKQQSEAADSKTKNIIVYDLGGGTFDVSVLSISPKEFKVLCSDSDCRLGGAAWDEKLAAIMMTKLAEKRPEAGDYEEDPIIKAELFMEVEQTKRRLSARNVAKATILCPDGSRERIEVTREEFETATRPELERPLAFTESMIKFAQEKKGVSKFDEFLLVGGSTYMPQVKAAIVERFTKQLGLEPKQYEPNQAVSKGAVIYGEIFDREDDFYHIIRTYRSIGIKAVAFPTQKEVCFNFILCNDEVPAMNYFFFKTATDNAEVLTCDILSNYSTKKTADLQSCKTIGKLEIKLTRKLPSQSPIRVYICLSSYGTLQFEALDVANDEELETRFTANQDEMIIPIERIRFSYYHTEEPDMPSSPLNRLVTE